MSRRAAAAQALCNGPLTDYLPQIRKLLKNKDDTVRLKVALALAGWRHLQPGDGPETPSTDVDWPSGGDKGD